VAQLNKQIEFVAKGGEGPNEDEADSETFMTRIGEEPSTAKKAPNSLQTSEKKKQGMMLPELAIRDPLALDTSLLSAAAQGAVGKSSQSVRNHYSMMTPKHNRN